MPKLDGTHLPTRIAKRLSDLKAGKEVSAKDIKALLNDEQLAEMNAEWAKQQKLRLQKRPRTKADEMELGWMTKREVHIKAYEAALNFTEDGLLESLLIRQKNTEIRAARIYLDEFFVAKDEGKSSYQANLAAQNELKRAHLAEVENERISDRDQKLTALEETLKAQIRKKMTPSELEQLQLKEEYETATAQKLKKGRKRTGKP